MSQEFTQLLLTDLAFLSEMTQELSYHENMGGLLQSLIEKTRDLLLGEMEYNRDLVDLKVLVLGEFNSGKSSFINSILQEEVCPVGVKPNTHRFTNVSYGERLKFLHGQQEISYREYISLVQAPAVMDIVRDGLNIKSPAAILKGICLVDTPGLSNPLQNQQGDDWVLTQLPISDIAFLIVNAHDRSGIFHSLNTLNQKKNSNPRLRWYLVLNRTDSLKTEQVEDLKSLIQNRYPDWFDSILCHTKTNENLMSLLRRLSMDRLEMLRSRRIRAQAEYKAMRTDILKRVHKTLKIPTDVQKKPPLC
jgi:tRNA U34 5-carboxymethylaminomethyl modifying GTPase MnmE/TrmE